MSPAQVLDVARAAGVRIEPRGDNLRLGAPEKPPDELLALLCENKPAILEYLGQGIGSAQPPEPHRPAAADIELPQLRSPPTRGGA